MTESNAATRTPASYWIWAGLGLIWNMFGVFQYLTSTGKTEAELMAIGMTAAQAALYASQPMWLPSVFAIGVFSGTLGCALLLARRRLAVPAFVVSLVGYVLLALGDWVQGIFAALGPSQVAIIACVVAIAAALLWYSRRADARGLLG